MYLCHRAFDVIDMGSHKSLFCKLIPLRFSIPTKPKQSSNREEELQSGSDCGSKAQYVSYPLYLS